MENKFLTDKKTLFDIIKTGTGPFLIKLIGILMTYGATYLLSNKIGAAGLGVISLLNSYLMLGSSILCFGLNSSIIRFVGEIFDRNDRSEFYDLLRKTIRIVFLLSIVLILVSVVFFEFNNSLDFLNNDNLWLYKCIVYILPFYSINLIFIEFLRSLKKFNISESLRNLNRPFFIIIAFIVLSVNDNVFNIKDIVYSVLVGIMCSMIFSGFKSFYYVKKMKLLGNKFLQESQMLKISFPMMINAFISNLRLLMPLFFLEYFFDSSYVGKYSIIVRISAIMGMVLVILNTFIAPKISNLYWNNKIDDLNNLLKNTGQIIFVLTSLILLIFFFFGKMILGFFGFEFVSVYSGLICYVISLFITSNIGFVGTFMNMTGNQVYYRNFNFITLVVSLIFYPLATYYFNIYGAIFVTIVSNIFINLGLCIYIFRKYKISTFIRF